ncbi:FlxA-like family protein [Rugamonas sp.]|uniref:FlxA-like family protein n=1 Tax=Rugamonas sp. TaxID=1926287 RepID=UPI0025F697A6|nr:FlxA-like family protein [Rugamonas sp.]
MVTSVAGTGGSHRVSDSSGAQGQINMLFAQIKALFKKIAQLQKQLMESTDPGERMRLMKEIIDLQRSVQLLEDQIAQIEQNQQLKAKNRAEAQSELKKENGKQSA